MVIRRRGSIIRDLIIPFSNGPDTFISGHIYFSILRSSDVPGLCCVISYNFGIPNYETSVFAVLYDDVGTCSSPGAVSCQAIL